MVFHWRNSANSDHLVTRWHGLTCIPGPAAAGLVVDVQAALLDHLATRTVLLLPTSAAPAPFKDSSQTFDIGGEAYVLVIQAIATILSRDLGKPAASVADQRDTIARALGFLLMGC